MDKKSKKFNLLIMTILIAGIVGSLTLNIAVDPLWYFKGNILQNKNYAFNEREAKTNLFLNNEV